MDKPISAAVGVINSSGVANMLVNVGSMRNRGFELELKSTNIQNKDLLWTTSLNIGHNKNKLTKLDGEQTGNYQWSFYPSCRSTILLNPMRMSMQVSILRQVKNCII